MRRKTQRPRNHCRKDADVGKGTLKTRPTHLLMRPSTVGGERRGQSVVMAPEGPQEVRRRLWQRWRPGGRQDSQHALGQLLCCAAADPLSQRSQPEHPARPKQTLGWSWRDFLGSHLGHGSPCPASSWLIWSIELWDLRCNTSVLCPSGSRLSKDSGSRKPGSNSITHLFETSGKTPHFSVPHFPNS